MAINIHKIFSDALLEMCKTKKLESITVKDILNETGVSRQAFYNRFRDKYDLIQWTYEHNILSTFLNNGPEASYYLNTLNFYKTLNQYRYFMKQAIALSGQNCLRDFIYQFALDYDLQYHKQLNGGKPLSDEFAFATWYHAAASIDVFMDWIASDNPPAPEIMAKRITNMRNISMSATFFTPGSTVYSVGE